MKYSTSSRRSETDGVDGEEVAGDDSGGLLAQECPPRRSCPPRYRIKPVAAQRRADRGCRDLYAQPEQLALDALVAPARILPGQTHDQRLHGRCCVHGDRLRVADCRHENAPSSSRSIPRAAFAGFRFPPEVIVVAIRWYLRFGLSYRDVEELLVEREVEVDHLTVYRWVLRFTPLLAEAARPCRHAVGDRWQVDET